jgi:gluconokinase
VCRRCREQRRRVECIGLGAAMHSLMALDRRGLVLTPSLTWADNRAAVQARRLQESAAADGLVRRTGTPLHPMSPLAKIMWFQENEPDIFRRAAHWMSIKEYVLHRLFGTFVVDHSIASATGLLDVERLVWDADALRAVGLEPHRLSELVPGTHLLRGLDADVARRLELAPETPWAVGASDGTLANLGLGAVQTGVAACTIGTSGAVRIGSARPLTDPRARTFCYVLAEGIWVVGGAINNGGATLAWVRDKLWPEAGGIDALIDWAAASPAGADGLLFLPYLLGERTPYWNPDARGVLFGLSAGHGREHVVRAALEGVLFQMLNVLEVLEQVAGKAAECRATGGFARAPLWRQMMADVFGRAVLFPRAHEASSLGAAMMAMVAVGALDSLADAESLVAVEDRHEPSGGQVEVYRRLFPLFLDLYEMVEDGYARLA